MKGKGKGGRRNKNLISMLPYALIVLQTLGMMAMVVYYLGGDKKTTIEERHGPPAPILRRTMTRTRTRSIDMSVYSDILSNVVDMKDPVRDPVKRTFRFFGDPEVCNRYPWKFCYIRGNLRLVRKIFKSNGWTEVKPEAESAELTWSLADLADANSYEFYHRLIPGTMVNHFPGIFELGNKKYLNINLKDYYDTFGEAFADFFPISFEVDKEMQKFKEAHEKLILMSRQSSSSSSSISSVEEAPMWVLKDPVGDRGEGVKVISGPKDLLQDDRRGLIVQQYIGNPYLLNGFKFTVRAYGLITSFDPLRVYVFRNGFVHMATDKYDPSPENVGNIYMHLTNPDINKHRPNHPYAKDPRPWYWSVDEMFEYMRNHGDDPDVFFENMKRTLSRAVLSAETKFVNRAHQHVQYRGNCFELFGADILVDRNLKTWLVEINPDPDMSAGSNFPLAERVKIDMLSQAFKLLGLLNNKDEDTKVSRHHRTIAMSTMLWQAVRSKTRSVLNIPFQRNCGAEIDFCALSSPDEAIVIAQSELELDGASKAGGLWERAYPPLGTQKNQDLISFLRDPMRRDILLSCWETALTRSCMV